MGSVWTMQCDGGCLLFLELEAGLNEAGTVLQPRLQAGPEVDQGRRYLEKGTLINVPTRVEASPKPDLLRPAGARCSKPASAYQVARYLSGQRQPDSPGLCPILSSASWFRIRWGPRASLRSTRVSVMTTLDWMPRCYRFLVATALLPRRLQAPRLFSLGTKGNQTTWGLDGQIN